MRVFIDIDDTLIIWKDSENTHPYGALRFQYGNDSAAINTPLVERIRAHAAQGHEIIFWSGGGDKYARSVVEWLLPEFKDSAFLTKDKMVFPLVRLGDIVVDDQPITVRTHTPTEEF